MHKNLKLLSSARAAETIRLHDAMLQMGEKSANE